MNFLNVAQFDKLKLQQISFLSRVYNPGMEPVGMVPHLTNFCIHIFDRVTILSHIAEYEENLII